MPATVTELTIYDGTDTAELHGGSDYELRESGWGPAVADERDGLLGGAGPLTDVVETPLINVIGTSGADMLANLNTLTRLLRKARRWAEDGQGTPVRVKVRAQGSNLTNPLEAVVLGAGPRWSLPSSFNNMLVVDEIQGVRVPFVRRGGLIGDESSQTSSGGNQPHAPTVTFTGATPAPAFYYYDIDVGGFATTSHNNINAGLLLATNAADKLILADAYNLDPGLYWSSVNDSGNKPAAGTNVLRGTPLNTAPINSAWLDLDAASFDVSQQRVAVAVTVRNNHATQPFTVWASGAGYDQAQASTTTKHVVDALTYDDPQPLFLGYVYVRGGVRFIRLHVQATDVSGSPTIDFDQVVVMAADDNGYALRHGSIALSSPLITSGAARLRVENRRLDELVPFVGALEVTNGREAPIEYSGDAVIAMTGNVVVPLWLSCNGQYWVDTDTSNANVSITYTIRRRPVYLVPQ